MSGIEKIDLDQQFDRLWRLAVKLGTDSADGWSLTEGNADLQPRTPWVVTDLRSGAQVMVLGYTRRAALSSLSSMNTFAAAVLGV